MDKIHLGFSPCPNDTFIFHGLVHGLVDSPVKFHPPRLEDVETLNIWAMQAKLEVTKLSFHALGYVLDNYCLLSSGSALGRGCGPLLVTAANGGFRASGSETVAIPGRYTTAALLFRMFAPQCTRLVEMRFDEIMNRVADGEVDAGVIIHESRFTYAEKGLHCVRDLGQWWEDLSRLPIPLGCIAVKRSLGKEKIEAIDTAIRQSIDLAFAQPDRSVGYIRKHAQELDENVIKEHINLYVNDYSRALGEEGLAAVERFLQLGREAGVLPESTMSPGI